MTGDGSVVGWKRETLQLLAKEFSPDGFQAVASRQALTRRRPPGEHVIHVAFVRHPHDLDLTVQLAVRLDRLRPLYRISQLGVEPMLGAEVGNMLDGRPRRWTIASSADAGVVVESIHSCCTSFALPWFAEAANLGTVYEWLRQDDRRAWLLAPVPMYHGFLLTALAGVVVSPQAATETAAHYSKLLLERRDPQAAQFAERVSLLLSALEAQP